MGQNMIYPKILQPRELNNLNQYALAQLGTPLFFASPELVRPHAKTYAGVLYEIVTGLYIVYHDYGMRILKTYLTFCENHQEMVSYNRAARNHLYNVENIRGGLCHGSLPGGAEIGFFVRKLECYFRDISSQDWPTWLNGLSEDECCSMVRQLSENSDCFVQYLRQTSDEIGSDDLLLREWREFLIHRAFNSQAPCYGEYYFDMRIITDLQKRFRPKKPIQNTIKHWLEELEPKLLNGTIPDADYLRHTLFTAIEDVYAPDRPQRRRSSASIFADCFQE